MNRLQQAVFKTCAATLFSCAALFSPLSSLSADSIEWPQIRLDNTGNTLAVWDVATNAGSHYIDFSYKPNGGSWSEPNTISTNGIDSYYPTVVMNPSGDAVAAWLITDPVWSITSICVSQYTQSTGTWSSPAVLSSSNELVDQNYDLRIDDAGNIVLIWKSYLISSGTNAILSSSSSIGNSWTTPTTITSVN